MRTERAASPVFFSVMPHAASVLFTWDFRRAVLGTTGWGSQPGQEQTQLEAEGLWKPLEHAAQLPEGCFPKGQPSEEGAESAPAKGNFIFTL